MYGFYRVAAALPDLRLAHVEHNADVCASLMEDATNHQVAVTVFPELTLTGYSVGDLFFQPTLLRRQHQTLQKLILQSASSDTLFILGIAFEHRNCLYNCAIAFQKGEILALIPKSYLPNTNEFYEKRHFCPGKDMHNQTVTYLGFEVPFGVDILLQEDPICTISVELCEDLWVSSPPSGFAAAAGATVLCNLSASNALIGKREYRQNLVQMQSARTMAAYIYTSAGMGESSSETLFEADAMVYENGSLLSRSKPFENDTTLIFADVDLERLVWQRRHETSLKDETAHPYRIVPLSPLPRPDTLERTIDPHPFVPSDSHMRNLRAEEITSIQAHALIRRLKHIGTKHTVIGLSGGLDSTLALLSTHKAYTLYGWDTTLIHAFTMPGLGTTSRTQSNATSLAQALKVSFDTIDISQSALEQLHLIGHDPKNHDIVYENTQARLRTALLMNIANQVGGIVVGTGNLSEIALGWSTYNGDHMSMYALNCSIPKTLVRYLVEYYAHTNQAIAPVLHDILDTPVSPELIPPQDNQISQHTELLIGPYELHDFFLYHFVRYGAPPRKILHLASIAFSGRYEKETIKKWLQVFLQRFFSQQFKRDTMPNGPKIGTVSLSPRADWRMPSDAYKESWLEDL